MRERVAGGAIDLRLLGVASRIPLTSMTRFFSFIWVAFAVTAASFGALSLYGYTTKRDLSAMGSFLIMGLFGLILASIVNIFLGSSALEFAISVIGVLIFAGLTAYDTQKIKEMYFESAGFEAINKMAIMGALNLYMDFINLFLFLLRFMGNRE